MPYVNVKIAGSLTDDQKREIAKQVTNTMQEVAGKPPQYTYVVIEEVPRTDWAIGGQLLADK
ncbi:MAG: 4-oxalocrotonate tautomerase family protein [Deltaproteobacteria bacterium]|nr:4-oxalocrotonate tautomerase family protein [Deltaproteobacteria bacterium]